MKLVLTSDSGTTLLLSVKLAFSVMEPMEKVSGLVSNERKAKSLKSLCISKPNVNRENNGDGGNVEGQFLKKEMVVEMNVALRGK